MSETAGNAVKTVSNETVTLEDVAAAVGTLRADYRHTDEYLHRIDQSLQRIEKVLEEHAPLLARARSLMDPGAGVRKFMTGKKEAGSRGR